MNFVAIDSVPKRITKGKIYSGNLVMKTKGTRVDSVSNMTSKLRIAVFDDSGEWMTFNPVIFLPDGMKFIPQELIDKVMARLKASFAGQGRRT